MTRPLRANIDLLIFRGRTLARQGDTPGARQTYRRCVQIDPRDGRGWLALARLSEREGKVDEAIETLKQGLKHEPSNAYILQAYGAIEDRRGNTDEAITLYTRALQSKPTHAASWVALSLVLQRRRKDAAAWRCLQLASAAEPRSYYVWQVRSCGRRQPVGCYKLRARASFILDGFDADVLARGAQSLGALAYTLLGRADKNRVVLEDEQELNRFAHVVCFRLLGSGIDARASSRVHARLSVALFRYDATSSTRCLRRWNDQTRAWLTRRDAPLRAPTDLPVYSHLQLNSANVATLHAWGVLEWKCGHTQLAATLFEKGLRIQPQNNYILQSWACMEVNDATVTGFPCFLLKSNGLPCDG